MRRLAIAVAIAASVAGGCLLTSDFDNVAGDRPSAEGGTEGGADAEAGASSPCATGDHVVCTDFDHAGGSFPPPGWNSTLGDGGVLVMDDTTSISPPRSLSARLEGANSPSAFITRQAFIASAFKTLTVSFSTRIATCPAQGKSITIAYVEPSSRVSFGLVFLSSGVQAIGASVNGTPTFFQLQKQIPEETWSKVVMRIELRDASTSHLTVTVDGATSVDTDAPGGPTKSSVQINLGLVGNGVSAPCEMRFDDYVLDRD